MKWLENIETFREFSVMDFKSKINVSDDIR
jgi:hypothetical protein